MSFLDKVMGVVKIAAPIAANIILPGAGTLASTLMDEVLDDAQVSHSGMSLEAKAQLVHEDPRLIASLKEKAMDLEATVSKEKTKNMAEVNATMKAELNAGKWYQRAWRPWNGFLFPIAVILIYVVVPVAKVLCIGKWPLLATLSLDVPPSLWMIWGGVLGIAVHGRNREKSGWKTPGPVAGAVGGLVKKLLK